MSMEWRDKLDKEAARIRRRDLFIAGGAIGIVNAAITILGEWLRSKARKRKK